jgi:hypothetical protein
MRWPMLMMVGAVMASAAALFAAPPALAVTRTVYAFTLNPANTAVSPNGGTIASPGDWISVTGLGVFNPTARTVLAGGTFVHYSATGAVVCQGTWKATGFTGFTDFGANAQGQEGGVLSLVVTHYCKTMGMIMTGIPMTITSTVNAPAGYAEGITVWDFTQPTGGTVTIRPLHR